MISSFLSVSAIVFMLYGIEAYRVTFVLLAIWLISKAIDASLLSKSY